MAAFALDTSCIIAAVCSWHEHHRRATAEIERRLDRGEQMIVPGAALVEAYAVLTRLPAPHRLSPADAWTLVDTNFVKNATVAALAARDYGKVLALIAARNEGGGRVYDSSIAESARRGSADVLLTFNRKHFDGGGAFAIVVPSA